MCGIYLAEGPRGKRQLLMCGLIARGRNESQMCGRFEKPRPRGRNGRQMCEALARMALKIAHLTSFFAKCAFRNPRKRTLEAVFCREGPPREKFRTFDASFCQRIVAVSRGCTSGIVSCQLPRPSPPIPARAGDNAWSCCNCNANRDVWGVRVRAFRLCARVQGRLQSDSHVACLRECRAGARRGGCARPCSKAGSSRSS